MGGWVGNVCDAVWDTFEPGIIYYNFLQKRCWDSSWWSVRINEDWLHPLGTRTWERERERLFKTEIRWLWGPIGLPHVRNDYLNVTFTFLDLPVSNIRLDDPFRVLMITERGYVMLLNRMNGIKTGWFFYWRKILLSSDTVSSRFNFYAFLRF